MFNLSTLTFVSAVTKGFVFDKAKLMMPKNREGFNKPVGGIWASSLNTKGTTEWIDWCRCEQFGDIDNKDFFVFRLAPNAKILIVDESTIPMMKKRYSYKYILGYEYDYVAISRDYDGIYVSSDIAYEYRLSTNYSLYTWDVETLCVWNDSVIIY